MTREVDCGQPEEMLRGQRLVRSLGLLMALLSVSAQFRCSKMSDFIFCCWSLVFAALSATFDKLFTLIVLCRCRFKVRPPGAQRQFTLRLPEPRLLRNSSSFRHAWPKLRLPQSVGPRQPPPQLRLQRLMRVGFAQRLFPCVFRLGHQRERHQLGRWRHCGPQKGLHVGQIQVVS